MLRKTLRKSNFDSEIAVGGSVSSTGNLLLPVQILQQTVRTTIVGMKHIMENGDEQFVFLN